MTGSGSMKRAVKPIPKGFHAVTSYLTVPGVAKLIDFLKHAFEAQELGRHALPDGRIMHAAVKIGDSIVMMGEPAGPQQPRPCNLYLYVEDVDTVYRRAVAAGGKSINEPQNQFYGDRSGGVEDPSGNCWWIASRVEDVSEAELARRFAAMGGKH